MGMVIGIDVGGSTTKIVGIDENNQIIQPMFITAADPVTSLFGAFGKYLHDNNIKLEDIEQVMVTGVGSAFVTTPIYNLPTQMVDEFTADGLGARHYIGIDKLIVVSMGTGTTFVKIDHDEIKHIGGMGIGGGTLQGLSNLLLKAHDISQVAEFALQGDHTKVDLLIGDVCKSDLPGLPLHATASLLGKAHSDSSKVDIAAGIRVIARRNRIMVLHISGDMLMRLYQRLARHCGEIAVGKIAAVISFSVCQDLIFNNSCGRVVML